MIERWEVSSHFLIYYFVMDDNNKLIKRIKDGDNGAFDELLLNTKKIEKNDNKKQWFFTEISIFCKKFLCVDKCVTQRKLDIIATMPKSQYCQRAASTKVGGLYV